MENIQHNRDISGKKLLETLIYTSSVATLGLNKSNESNEETPVTFSDMIGDYKKSNLDYEKVVDIGDPIQKLDSIIYLMDNKLILSNLSKLPELIKKAKLLLNQSDNKEKEGALLYAESRYYLFAGNFKKSEELSKKCLVKANDLIYENACSSLLSNIYINNK